MVSNKTGQKAKNKKPTTSRKNAKYPNLNPKYNLKSRREEIEDVESYLKQLNEEEKAWMNKFMGEYVGASLDFKNLENNLHNTKELKKSCTDRNNARNRDIQSRAANVGLLDSIEEVTDKEFKTLIPHNSYEVEKKVPKT
jgi:hypothetical protein